MPTESATGMQAADAKMQYNFKFDGVFGPAVSQEEVFTTTSKAICDRFLDGFNGTIFAYGQVGGRRARPGPALQ